MHCNDSFFAFSNVSGCDLRLKAIALFHGITFCRFLGPFLQIYRHRLKRNFLLHTLAFFAHPFALLGSSLLLTLMWPDDNKTTSCHARFERAYPDAWPHVMNRGRRAETIFSDVHDYDLFASAPNRLSTGSSCTAVGKR